ncbi:hypothetical protein GGX14DRAFT_580563 [Mycena pura]|uniref:Hydrophobin n=1 Tax=Mycena pura TaxID=153505 RepID=A0AAD6Y133_9AGAR|nr:hypothetical protein GGX14DRAFT_580563 [Mycena pura]
MQLTSAFVLLVATTVTRAALNGPCSNGGGAGICLTTASCQASGGTSTPGLCPDTAADVQCCTKHPCSSTSLGATGVCRFSSSCTGAQFTISGVFVGFLVITMLSFMLRLVSGTIRFHVLRSLWPSEPVPLTSPTSLDKRLPCR